ncbi:alpha/beta hydrolase [Nodularia harveyana UHCC-0300]|uniref:Alpha/beta hydrolase n=1 Tax=Nodularia harveyana UHCC-0300 TaxID=2974287 RepID=A0ABU5UC45_9CYAN|nr:alpha/beta hydrolase [Nodularia harveyana]MEA5580695.1 alpha/beta hydrolase [Nodularia harveyana UHCC-0300]
MITLTDIPPDKYIKVGEINTRYWTLGNNEKTIILLHCAGGSVEFWFYNIQVLAQYYRVYAIDMVGSGLSDKPSATYSLSYQAEFIKNFMDTLNIKIATLVGNSMGGAAAIQLSLMFPNQVEKLILIGSFGLGKEINLRLRLATLPLGLRFFPPNGEKIDLLLKREVYNWKIIPPEWKKIRYPIYSLPHREKPLMQLARTHLNLFGVRKTVFSEIVKQLGNITAPTLIIWGKQDPILPVSHAEVAAKGLPNNQLHIFDSCGHYPHLEFPDKFNSLVLNFLAE